MVVVKFTILKSEFKQAENFCKANLSMPQQNQVEFVGSMLFWFAHQELWLEEQDTKERKKFGTVKYPKLFPISDCYIVQTNLRLTRYRKMSHELQQVYPKMVNEKDKSVTAFLAHLGYVFIKKAENGQVDPGIIVAARNISKIMEHTKVPKIVC
ncbi:hypothetical protein OZX69_09675 (plasmid) [Lactobacillus sp. ESL0731]|uniref:hypothetical protein n=1 Tax=unclassified Lactobacillus TaxID=2620435 RepID=UPI0023F9FC8A|nr:MULTISPECIES: hypothetical protein [unclassified Lactobacillus]WEV52088.1 hypothetical protein OZX63_09650 [Lactobacillus sp. ESL0700]WEV63221.1 hypothetical protein OZX69_09675 [Lactobacillus sp. ESL0731]